MVFYNGDFKDERDVFVSSNSRAFNYGDGFFETVKVINSKPFNFPCHIDRIKFALSTLKISDNYTSAFFEDKFSFLLKANKIVNGSIKIHISRNGIGRYLPESNKSDLFISVVNGLAYKKNNPISLCFYDKQFKAIGTLSNIKSSNSLVSVLASIHAFENNYDNAILINHSAKVIESANANIFILKDKYIYTPPISDGCVDGTMRKWILNSLDVTKKSILHDDILSADEVFITNASNGVTSVKNIDGKYFSSFNTASFLQQKLINLSLGL